MFRQTFGGPAQFFVHDVLRLPPNTLIARYTKIFTTFFISGVLHLSGDIAVGIPLGESGSIRFFCMQALVIILEDSVQALYHRFFTKQVGTKSSRWGNLSKLIGYFWLWGFLIWSTPVWAYPAMRRNRGSADHVLLPFSIMKPLTGKI